MSGWYAQVDVTLPRQPALLRLARELSIPPAYAVGLLSTMWAAMREGGDPTAYSLDDIEAVVGWAGEAEALGEALVDTGWISVGELGQVTHVRGWDRYEEADNRRVAEAERKRLHRLHRRIHAEAQRKGVTPPDLAGMSYAELQDVLRDIQRTSAGCPTDVPRTSTGRPASEAEAETEAEAYKEEVVPSEEVRARPRPRDPGSLALSGFPLREGFEDGFTAAELKQLVDAFPTVDVEAKLRDSRAYLLAERDAGHPKRLPKGLRGLKQFARNQLSDARDRGRFKRGGPPDRGPGGGQRFSNRPEPVVNPASLEIFQPLVRRGPGDGESRAA